MAYALEIYRSNSRPEARPDTAVRVLAAAHMRGRGTTVRFLQSIFIPRDEVCFLLFDAPGDDVLAEVARDAAISFERVVELEITAAGGRVGGGGPDGS